MNVLKRYEEFANEYGIFYFSEIFDKMPQLYALFERYQITDKQREFLINAKCFSDA